MLGRSAETQEVFDSLEGTIGVTLSMMELYGREMRYRYGVYALPVDELRSDGYEAGAPAYWVPGGGLVILYKQNGEEFV